MTEKIPAVCRCPPETARLRNGDGKWQRAKTARSVGKDRARHWLRVWDHHDDPPKGFAISCGREVDEHGKRRSFPKRTKLLRGGPVNAPVGPVTRSRDEPYFRGPVRTADPLALPRTGSHLYVLWPR